MPQYNVPLAEAAKTFGVSYHKLWAMCKRGELPHARLGKTFRLCMADLEKLIVPKCA